MKRRIQDEIAGNKLKKKIKEIICQGSEQLELKSTT